jgi:formylglycine-generating enzyme required for sulfatase activity
VRQRKFKRSGRPLVLPALLAGALLLVGGVGSRFLPQRASPTELAALRSHTPAGMTPVPGGDCWIGTDDLDADEDVKPKRRVFVPSFYIDVNEVTNGEFQRFDPSYAFLPGQENLPATNVTYDQAAAYARWAGKRLPTETEWEKAARGTDGRRYPWGDRWDARRVASRARTSRPPAVGSAPAAPVRKVCFIGPQRVRPVRSVPDGVSPYGCYDMAGNAWEWVQGFYNGNPEQRILRGGAVGYGERACRTYTHAIEGAGAT